MVRLMLRVIVQGMVLLPLVSLPVPAFAEFSLLFYFGKSLTGNGTLRLQKVDSDLAFHGVRWEDRSFRAPIYYGVRASYWLPNAPEWGAAVDFTHAKTILREKDVVPVTGSRRGSPVEGREPISETLRHFELSHGLNMVTFNALHRWFPLGTETPPHSGGLQCYTGVGAGLSVPHVEALLKDEKSGQEEHTGRYQFPAGPVLNAMLGLNLDFSNVSSAVAEYKLSYAHTDADLAGGGRVEAETLTHQFVTGLSGNGNF